MMRWILILMFCTVLSSYASDDKILLSGTVLDAESNRVLPMATIALGQHNLGTLSDQFGRFELFVPIDYRDDTCWVSYLGYESASIFINADTGMMVHLNPQKDEIAEILVRPQTPEQLIKEAVQNSNAKYVSAPFNSLVYFQDEVLENDEHIKHDESVFEIHHPFNGSDDQFRLILKKEHERIPMKFLKEKTSFDSVQKYLDITQYGLQAMNEVSNLNADLEIFLDTNQFDKFNYSYNPVDHKAIVVDFKSKKKIDHMKVEGKIFIDKHDRVIQGIASKGIYVVPFYVKPLLFFMGLRVVNPTFYGTRAYDKVNEFWFQKNVFATVEMKLVKIRWFKTNEKAHFQIKQSFIRKSDEPLTALKIPIHQRFRWGVEQDNQVFEKEGITWEMFE